MLKRDRSDAAGIPANLIRDDYPLLKTCNNRCAALSGVVGESVSCTIYENRPQACRQFKAGSLLCLEARQSFYGKTT
ncbi:Putative zinc- or iron-chelating domain containing protein [uncultured Caudovirales phage]|uniref:Zinc- or iron-chelating domain containing protein n=1 Tax=uncultured Caudovirales phage TaxID=2100421 RepID=A0A6J5LQS3_9CAUD|nr:Putative zinc- or iron-chelating domain containing protein [uncultured Caudovirales phage]CAB4150712.1 Putative zinc- or iron-chelating domain containing protein [uncultured Caudovirales phage]